MALADEALSDAAAARERGSERNCMNRCYYAAFYAASGLLTVRGLHSSKHRGVLSLFDRELVLSGEMSRNTAARCTGFSSGAAMRTMTSTARSLARRPQKLFGRLSAWFVMRGRCLSARLGSKPHAFST